MANATLQPSSTEALQERLSTRTGHVGVVGLGGVGLPLLQAFISFGFSTLGFDVDAAKIEQLQSGKSYTKHIPSDWIIFLVGIGFSFLFLTGTGCPNRSLMSSQFAHL